MALIHFLLAFKPQVRTGYDNAPGHLVFEHTPQHDSVRYAYW